MGYTYSLNFHYCRREQLSCVGSFVVPEWLFGSIYFTYGDRLMAETGKDPAPDHPEVIVVAHPDAALRVEGNAVRSAAVDAAPLEHALTETGAQASPLFGPSEEEVQTRRDESPWDLPDLSVFYRVRVGQDHEAVAARLNEEESVAGAFVKPPVGMNQHVQAEAVTTADAAAPATPNLSDHQGYLDAPPGGVNARTAWTKPGGDGTGVHLMIVGGAWRLTHEDLVGVADHSLGSGQQIDSVSFRNHGTAILGIVRANNNTFGVTGVAPAAQVGVVATFGLGTAGAIHFAAESLPAGGIILIEWQRPGPGSTGVGSAGFLPLEWWPDDFAAIAFATAKGVIVVEPAGNGSVSLDDPFYNTPAPGFPASWKNPFNRAVADCGAILVGAGTPPPQTHGHDRGPDRSRMQFSNYGSSLDVQGWGAELTTLGYGDLQGGPDEDRWYADNFGGTSGAAAQVAGAIASLQGLELSGAKRPPLTPADVRRLLRQSGSPQQDGSDGPAAARRIGSRPDLLALMALLAVAKDEAKEAKESKESKDNKDAKDKEQPDKNIKDAKDNKENKESKDGKDRKDNKDGKNENKEDKGDGKEKPDNKEKHEKGENPNEQPFLLPERDRPAAAARWRSEEPVRHFIAAEHRPDLAAAALLTEPDLLGLSAAELADGLRPPDEVLVDS